MKFLMQKRKSWCRKYTFGEHAITSGKNKNKIQDVGTSIPSAINLINDPYKGNFQFCAKFLGPSCGETLSSSSLPFIHADLITLYISKNQLNGSDLRKEEKLFLLEDSSFPSFD
ncbi:hypothetical protein AAHE18_19G044900 [Arachis hypogaea]